MQSRDCILLIRVMTLSVNDEYQYTCVIAFTHSEGHVESDYRAASLAGLHWDLFRLVAFHAKLACEFHHCNLT